MAIDKDQALRRRGNLNRKGRPKGAKSLRPHKDIFSRCWDANFDPMDNIIPIAQGELKCLVCRGNLEARYPLTDGEGKRIYETDPETGQQNVKTGMSLCRSCYGTGWEHMNVADVLKANEMLLARMYPALKQIDHTSMNGSMRPTWNVVIAQQTGAPQGDSPQGASGGQIPPRLMAKHDDEF